MLLSFRGLLGRFLEAWIARSRRRLGPLAALFAASWVVACNAPPPGPGDGTSSRPPAAVRPGKDAPARLSPAFDIGDVMRRVHFAYRQDGEGWSGGHDTYRVQATAERFRVTPVQARETLPALDPDSRDAPPSGAPGAESRVEQGAAAIFETTSMGRSAARRLPEPGPGHVEPDGHLALSRSEAVEHLSNREDGVEQAFSFEHRPEGSGDLTVRVRVSGQTYAGESEQGLHFVDPETGLGVRYGRATWVDADGQKTPVTVQYDAGELVLTVPEHVLGISTYPAVLDPTISPEFGMDNPVSSFAANNQQLPNLAFDGQSYLVVWWDLRALDPAVVGGRIYGTRVSPAGTVLDPNGIVVGTGLTSTAVRPGIAFNGSNYLVAWSGTSNSLQTALVSPAGAVTGPTSVQAFGTAPVVASDGASFLVTWTGTNGIEARRLTGGGATLGSQFTITSAVGTQRDAAITFDGTNYLVVWQDNRSGLSYDIYGARVSTAGTVLDAAGFLVAGATADQTRPSVAFDGANSLVVWSDGKSGTPDIYGALVGPNGAVFNPVGIGITPMIPGDQTVPSVAFDGTGYRITWADDRSGSSDVYGGRVDVNGMVLDGTGIPLSQGTALEQSTVIRCGGGTCLAVWQDRRAGSAWDIYGTRVDGGGAAVDPSGFVVSTAANDQVAPSVAFDGQHYLVVWQDRRVGLTWDIYGARVTGAGTVLDPSGIAVSAADGDQLTPKIAWDGSAYLAVWEDRRSGNPGDIYGARVGSDGVVLDTNGLAISTAINQQSGPALVWNGSSYLVVWTDMRVGTRVYGARVTPTGVVQDPAGITISTSPGQQIEVAFDGTNHLVVWSQGTGTGIVGGRVTLAGGLLDGLSGFVISANGASSPAVAFDGVNFLVVYELDVANSDLRGRRVTPNGAVLEMVGFTISGATGNQVEPAVVFDGTDCLVTWRDYRAGAVAQIYGTWVTELADILQPNGILISGSFDHGKPALASDLTGRTLVAYSHADPAPSYSSYRVRARLITSVPVGGACTLAADCVNNLCIDGFCCNAPCGGGSTSDCLACSVAAGAAANGICGPTTGTACSDGNGCTQNDACQAGACQPGAPVSCPDPAACHSAGSCNAATGQCLYPAQPDDTACDDADGCTQADTCQAGTCVGASPVLCLPLDGCHLAGACNPANGQCTDPPKPDGSGCDDSDACTQTDTCQSGVCTVGSPLVCPQPDDCHSPGTCDVATGTCAYATKANGAACDDGNPCTQTDACQSGTCTGSSPVACPAPDACHQAGMCNPATGQCQIAAQADGTACDDGNPCTTADACQSGTCAGASQVQCPTPGPCQSQLTCNPASGRCEPTLKPDDSPCNDGDACTQADTCQSGQCIGAEPVPCPGDDCHEAGTCAPDTGACTNSALPDGTPCNQGVCEAGACVPPGVTSGGSTGGGGAGAGGSGGSTSTNSEGTGLGGPTGAGGGSPGSKGGFSCRIGGEEDRERTPLAAAALALAVAGVVRRRRRRHTAV